MTEWPLSSNSQDFKHELCKIVRKTLVNTSKEATNTVSEHLLNTVGVELLSDLPLIKEEDLFSIGFLKPMQIRRLLSAFKEMHESSVEKTACTPKSILLPEEPLVVSLEEEEDSRVINGLACKEYADCAENITIPWNTFPEAFMKSCRLGIRPNPRLLRSVIRTVADLIAAFSTRPGRKVLRSVAKKLVSVYPEALADCTDEGVVIQDGTFGIMKMLENKFDCYNRRKRVLADLKTAEENSNTLCHKKSNRRCIKDSYGCVNWDPEDQSGLSLANQKLKIEWLQLDYEKKEKKLDLALEYMELMYASQRKDINSGVPVADLLKKWPYIQEPKFLFQHFKTLMGFSINIVTEEIEKKCEKLLRFFKHIVEVKRDSTVLQLKTRLGLINQADLSSEEKLAAVIPLLIAYFNEKEEALILIFDDTTQMSNITKNPDHPRHPCINIFGTANGTDVFTVSLDAVCILNTKVWTEAVEGLIASFYVYNVQYPSPVRLTLEFIQRSFIKLNPERGSKGSSKSKCRVDPKVQLLFNQLRDFENDWSI